MKLGLLVAGICAVIAGASLARAQQSPDAGKALFVANCSICHQITGAGLPGVYPPLADSIGSYVATPGGRAYVVHAVLFGISGPITVHGQAYNGVMQAWPQLSDDGIADVLNYALVELNAKMISKKFARITADEVKATRAKPMTPDQVYQERQRVLQGMKMAGVSSGASK